MKIKVEEKSIDEVLSLPGYRHEKPGHQSRFFRWVMKTLSAGELRKVSFRADREGMDKIGEGEPCLVLMNHSSFIDLEIASTLLYPSEFHIICTADGFVGKERLMRAVGCIPTFKFISDPVLVKDIVHTLRELKSSVLLYPEASYSFDGTATPLPDSMGKLLKLLKVPVVMIRTYGAFTRDPLYNGLRKRNVQVSAKMYCLFTKEEIAEQTVPALNARLKEAFTFDHFRWQEENRIAVTEDFRAEGLERVLYQCPVCGKRGGMKGAGTQIRCGSCGASWTLTEYGTLDGPRNVPEGKNAAAGQFRFVPDWYAWEREEVRREIREGTYRTEAEVEILCMVNTDAVYRVGEGTLLHTAEGFLLTGCGGKLSYRQSAKASYSLYADYFWYEIGDMVSIGTAKIQYYCFPKDPEVSCARMRLAAEELYRAAEELYRHEG